MLTQIQKLYTNLPYHNWQHALTVHDRALAILQKIQSLTDVDINVNIIELATYGHDACFGADIKGFKSQEHFTAHIIENMLRKDYDEDFVSAVTQAILATNPWIEPISIEAKILRAADMGGLMHYDIYREDFNKLMQENEANNEREFLLKSLNFLALYIWPSVHLTPNYYNTRGTSAWHSNTISNIIRHYRELFDEPVIVEIGSGANPCVLFEEIEGLVIGVEPDKTARKDAISLLWGNKKTELIVPGTGAIIPVEEAIDSLRYYNVVLRHTEALNSNEINRLKPQNVEIIETFSPTLGHKDTETAKKEIAKEIPYNLIKDTSAANLPNASGDAFRLTFEIGNAQA